MAFTIDVNRKKGETDESSSLLSEQELKKLNEDRRDRESSVQFSNKVVRVACTPEELEEMRKRTQFSYVNDYGNDSDYFLSLEERKAKYQAYEYRRKVMGNRNRYNNIKGYIIACRNCYEYIKHLAKNDMVTPEDEWMKLYYAGKINVYDCKFPKISTKLLKKVNKLWLVKAITDPNYDVKNIESDLKPVDTSDFKIQSDLTDADIKLILNEAKNLHVIKYPKLATEDEVYSSNIPIAPQLSNKSFRALKNIPEFSATDDMVKSLSSVKELNRGNIMDISKYYQSEMDKINREIVNKHLFGVDPYPEFKGDILSKEDLDLYIAECTAWENRHNYITDPSDNKKKTIAQKVDDDWYNMLDEYYDMRKFRFTTTNTQLSHIVNDAEMRIKQAQSIVRMNSDALRKRMDDATITDASYRAYKIKIAEGKFTIKYLQYVIDNHQLPSVKIKKKLLKKYGLTTIPVSIAEMISNFDRMSLRK